MMIIIIVIKVMIIHKLTNQFKIIAFMPQNQPHQWLSGIK